MSGGGDLRLVRMVSGAMWRTFAWPARAERLPLGSSARRTPGVGTWTEAVAEGWLVDLLTDNAVDLGLNRGVGALACTCCSAPTVVLVA